MYRIKITAKHLVSVGYDPDSMKLEVESPADVIRTYSGVPEDVANGLMDALDRDAYYLEHIQGRFDAARRFNRWPGID